MTQARAWVAAAAAAGMLCVAVGAAAQAPRRSVAGPIVAQSGQVIENVHVSTAQGPCIVVPEGMKRVVVRDSEIGPCGQPGDPLAIGIDIRPGASHVTIERNVLHDVASGVYAYGARHPIVVDRNRAYHIRGPFPRGQLVQFNAVIGGEDASRITCNVSDVLNQPVSNVEDHVNLFNSWGLPGRPIVIAWNRVRGGHSPTGSGIMTGDGESGGHVHAHDNVVVNVGNTGMGIAGGSHIVFERNRIFLDGRTSRSRIGLYAYNYISLACSDHRVANNRVWAIDVIGQSGAQNHAWIDDAGCRRVAQAGNRFGDRSLSAAMFDEVPSACR